VVSGNFHKIILRESRVPRLDSATWKRTGMTELTYFEVCTSASVYEILEKPNVQAVSGVR
jgi:hypothetical protein